MKKICILGYKFYEYEKEIIDSFSKKYNVIFIDYSINFFEFFLCKVFGKYLKNYILNKKISKKIETDVDILFCMSGKELSKENMIYIFKIIPKSKKILYLWDDCKRVQNVLEIREYFDKILSFDYSDCIKYGFRYRPAFYSSRLKKIDNFQPEINLFFIGVYREERLEFLKNLYGDGNFIYLYYPKHFFYLLRILKKRGFENIDIKYINFKQIDKQKYNQLFINSKYIIDIPDKNQSGFTQRILDAIYLEKKIITTQLNVKNEKFYNENNILVIDSKKEIDLRSSFFKTEYQKISKEIINYYSIETWTKEILEGED